MKDKDIINQHCEEVQEIMGDVPNRIMRWGISVIALILLILFAGSCFFYYPDTLTAGIDIIPIYPPVEMRATHEGYIKKLMTVNGKGVSAGDALVVLDPATDSKRDDIVLKSPIEGKVNFMEPIFINRPVYAGETLMTILPNTIERPIGEIRVPASQVGKVRSGQHIKINLELYSDDKYGSIEGQVDDVSSMPDNHGMYYTQVIFPNRLKTDYGKYIPLNQRLSGTAEIVIDNKKLIERFIQPMERYFNVRQ